MLSCTPHRGIKLHFYEPKRKLEKLEKENWQHCNIWQCFTGFLTPKSQAHTLTLRVKVFKIIYIFLKYFNVFNPINKNFVSLGEKIIKCIKKIVPTLH